MNIFNKIKKILHFIVNLIINLKPINFQKTYEINNFLKFSPDFLVKKLDLKIKGVVCVGANRGQEVENLKKINPHLKFLLFEPVSNSFQILKEKFSYDNYVNIVNKALGSRKFQSKIFVASNEDQSSSILKPKEHLNYSKKILFNKSELVDVDILDTYFNNLQDYNFLIIDTQGYELEVLKGAEKSLNFFDYIYIEVNKEEVYENCALFSELDKFLRHHNFHCSHIRWWKIWGDALYVKNINLKS